MKRVFEFLKEHQASNVAIFSHIRGDGDCLGAQTGLAEVLSSAGLRVVLYNQDKVSTNFAILPRFTEIAVCTENGSLPDVCIAVDCATIERIGELPEQFRSRPWINIDHHISNSKFGTLNIIDGDASSTCEILARMIYAAEISPSTNAATALFTGISTDTGSFLYQNAHAPTFYIAAKLLEDGADKSLVQQHIFENTSRKQVEVYRYLYDHLNFFLDDHVAYCVYSKETLDAMHATSLTLEGVVSMIKEIQGVEVAVLFSEPAECQVKISLRSREWFDCNRCCNTFGGGGHIRASGATLEMPIETAVEKVLDEIRNEWGEMSHAK